MINKKDEMDEADWSIVKYFVILPILLLALIIFAANMYI